MITYQDGREDLELIERVYIDHVINQMDFEEIETKHGLKKAGGMTAYMLYRLWSEMKDASHDARYYPPLPRVVIARGLATADMQARHAFEHLFQKQGDSRVSPVGYAINMLVRINTPFSFGAGKFHESSFVWPRNGGREDVEKQFEDDSMKLLYRLAWIGERASFDGITARLKKTLTPGMISRLELDCSAPSTWEG